MSSDPTVMKKSSPKPASGRPSMQLKKGGMNEKSPFADINEVESGRSPSLLHTQSSAPAQLDAPGLSPISFSQIINHIWHFVSVDFGPRCSFSYHHYVVLFEMADCLVGSRYVYWL